MKKVLFIFTIIYAINLITSLLAPKIIPYLGFFPYSEDLKNFILYPQPLFINAFANFDGIHYLKISQFGYSQYEQAFFPLYPLLIKGVTVALSINPLIAGLIISNIFLLAGMIILKQYLSLIMNKQSSILWFIIFFLIFPTSFFLNAVYTEGLFFFLLIASLYFFQLKKYWLTIIFSILCSLTRITGLLLIIPFGIKMIEILWRHQWRHYKLLLVTFLSPFLGLFIYCFHLWQTTGDPFLFINVQPIFGAHRSTSIILFPQVLYRYVKIFWTADRNYQYFISILEATTFVTVLFVLIRDLINIIKTKFNDKYFDRLGLNLFSLVNLLLPTLTGTFSSIPRYALFSLSFFIALSNFKNFSIKLFIATVFLIIHIIILGFYIQGYFVS